MFISSINKYDHIFGNRQAKIKLLVYEDYECENCGKAFRELNKLREWFKQKICIEYLHFPQAFHPFAFSAALVAEAAALQMKFIQTHDLIFERQEYLEYGLGGILRLLAKDYAVSLEQLSEDMKKEELKRKINEDFENGVENNVKNTPAIFINGNRYLGDIKFPLLRKAIRQALQEIRLSTKKVFSPMKMQLKTFVNAEQ